MRLYGILESQAQKVIGELDAFDKSISKEKLDRDRTFLSLQRKSNEIRKGMEELKSSSRKSSNALKSWWKDMNKDGTTGIPLDPKVTDILTKTKKNQTIAMPAKQPFKGLVKFENVPESAESQFRTIASKALQANVDAGLKDVRSLVAKKVDTFNDQFRVADQKSDEKRAKALFDNFNHFLQNELNKDLEKVVEEAAEASLVEAVAKLKDDRTQFKNRGTKVGKIVVDTSGFFSVEVVMSNNDPAAEVVASFTEASKDLEKAQSSYQSAVGAIEKSLPALEQTFKDLTRRMGTLSEDVRDVADADLSKTLKADTGQREKLLESIGGEMRTLQTNQDRIVKEADKLSKSLTTVSKEFEKSAQDKKDNQKVSKRSVEDFRKALAAYTKALDRASKYKLPDVDWMSNRPSLERTLVASRAKKEFQNGGELAKTLGQQQKLIEKWQKAVSTKAGSVGKDLSVEKSWKELEAAASKLGSSK